MSGKNREIIEKVNAAFAKGDVEEFLSFCAENVEWIMVGGETVKGKDAIRKWMATMDAEPPKFTVTNIIAEGDFAVTHGDMTMKDKDGKLGSYSYCDIYRFRDDKIVELRAFVIKTTARSEASSGHN